jgi:diguanylate cyclase (GGDEF)-like protein
MDLAVPLLPDTSAAFDLEATLDQALRLTDRGDARAGRALAEQALAEARTHNDVPRTARALGIVANASRCLADYERAAAAALENVGLLDCAAAKIDLALLFFDLGDASRALSHLFEARQDLSHAPDGLIEARCAQAEGLVQSRLREFDVARASFAQALELRRGARDDAGAATTLISLGVVHLRIAQLACTDARGARIQFERALDHFRQARDLALQNGDNRLVLLAEVNIADAVGGLGCHDDALERFLAQLPTARALGDRHNESLILNNAGEAARRSGQLARARVLGEEGLAIAQATSSKDRERDARLQLSLTCEAAGDYAAALAHYKVHHALEREMHAAETRRVTQAQALRGAVEQVQRESSRLRRENRVPERQDALTGLANRRAFDDALAARLGEARKAGTPLAVVAFDLDHFKSINDRHTHAAGDSVLREVASALRRHCRTSDLAARIGGEEFVLLLPGADRAAACAIAERVRAEVAFRPFSALAAGIRVTLSAGVAVDTGHGRADELLCAADAALCRAKSEGRDRVCAT